MPPSAAPDRESLRLCGAEAARSPALFGTRIACALDGPATLFRRTRLEPRTARP